MRYYIITGTSKGLGRSIAQKLIQKPGNFVIGVSRSASLTSDHYVHVNLDLSDLTTLNKNYDKIFPKFDNPEKIVLINNAGTMGEISYLGNITDESIILGYNCNVIAPAMLMNEFVKRYKELSCPKVVVNVSSGAGKKPVDGWLTYCSTKSALDMLTAVAAKEAKFSHTNFRFYSVSPGIVDTEMQTKIRNVSPEDFSRVEEFINYKKEHMLDSPDKVAEKYIQFLEHDEMVKGVVLSVREI
ncbi:MAG: SDR family NAD(P)-dependent oxidoreductase [Cytophagaceae bacterium]